MIFVVHLPFRFTRLTLINHKTAPPASQSHVISPQISTSSFLQCRYPVLSCCLLHLDNKVVGILPRFVLIPFLSLLYHACLDSFSYLFEIVINRRQKFATSAKIMACAAVRAVISFHAVAKRRQQRNLNWDYFSLGEPSVHITLYPSCQSSRVKYRNTFDLKRGTKKKGLESVR